MCSSDLETLLFAGILDKLSLLVWSKTDDAQSGKNKPKSILLKMLGESTQEDREYMTFDSIEDFERMRNQILNKGEG